MTTWQHISSWFWHMILKKRNFQVIWNFASGFIFQNILKHTIGPLYFILHSIYLLHFLRFAFLTVNTVLLTVYYEYTAGNSTSPVWQFSRTVEVLSVYLIDANRVYQTNRHNGINMLLVMCAHMQFVPLHVCRASAACTGSRGCHWNSRWGLPESSPML